jgi:RNA polymerase sigma-70 factor (ECF subfamily)
VGAGRVDSNDGEVFAAHYSALRRFAAAVRPQGVDPDDLVQEAVARTLAVRSLSELEEPLAYLRAAVLRVALNVRRSKRRNDAYIAAMGAPDAGRSDHYPSDLAELWAVPPAARAVLFLTVVESCSYREAAEMLGCSEEAARQMAARARRLLRVSADAELRAGDAS